MTGGSGAQCPDYPAGSAGVLAMLAEPELRAELDRVAAAAGVRVVHAGDAAAVSRKTWAAAAAVVLDAAAAARCGRWALPRRDHVTERSAAGPAAAVSRKTWAAPAPVVLDAAAAARCGRWALPRRDHVTVLTAAEPATTTWAAAVRIGAARVLRLPEHEADLVGELAEAAESSRDDGQRGHAVAVIGGCGGAGASLLAVALAQAAGDALLVDLDPWGGGIELLLGGENTPGLRWPDLALQGGRLNWAAVRDALPRHRGVSVLSGTRRGHEVDAGPVHAVVDAGRRGAVSVICDLPRRFTDAAQAALGAADLVVVVSRCDVRACAATGALAPVLAAVNPNVGLVVRGPSPGGLRAAEIAGITGLPLLAAIKAQPQLGAQVERVGLRLGRRSALAVAARQVLGVLPPAGARRKGKAA
ncbi:septum site-determining protein Ssd [Mycobacterium avium subsp. hominissuis]